MRDDLAEMARHRLLDARVDVGVHAQLLVKKCQQGIPVEFSDWESARAAADEFAKLRAAVCHEVNCLTEYIRLTSGPEAARAAFAVLEDEAPPDGVQ